MENNPFIPSIPIQGKREGLSKKQRRLLEPVLSGKSGFRIGHTHKQRRKYSQVMNPTKKEAIRRAYAIEKEMIIRLRSIK
jgi:hypothetical protein